jgi:GT2 family glycosyltransferase
MDVSIVIVNYNTSKLLFDCISSIRGKTKDLEYEIIVVDNSSSDDSCDKIRSFFPEVNLIENKANLGFGRANNQGAEIAKGQYLFLLNTDTILLNNAIRILFDFMEKEESQDIAACGGNLFCSDNAPNFSYSRYFPSLYSIFCYRAHLTFLLNNESFNKTGKIKDVAIIIGADLFLRKKVFDELKGFDPSMFMYVEDGELQFRINKMNYRIVSNPQAEIMHLQGTSSSKTEKLRMEISSYVLYFGKHHKSYKLRIYKVIELFFASLRSLILFMTFRKKESIEYLSVIKYILNLNSDRKRKP